MTRKQENLTYLVLFFVAFTMAVYLIVEAATMETPPIEPLPKDVLGRGSQDDFANDDTHKIFMSRDLQYPIITPLPTPTRVVRPTPTHTPVPFMQKWTLKAILGDFAMITDETGKPKTVKEGDDHNGVLIKEVGRDYIVGEFLKDGQGRTQRLNKQGIK